MVTGGGIKLMLTFIFYIHLPTHRCKTPLDELKEKGALLVLRLAMLNNALGLQYPPS